MAHGQYRPKQSADQIPRSLLRRKFAELQV